MSKVLPSEKKKNAIVNIKGQQKWLPDDEDTGRQKRTEVLGIGSSCPHGPQKKLERGYAYGQDAHAPSEISPRPSNNKIVKKITL